jgi:hypothetical protein
VDAEPFVAKISRAGPFGPIEGCQSGPAFPRDPMMCEPLMGLLGHLPPYKPASLHRAPSMVARREIGFGFLLLLDMVTEA